MVVKYRNHKENLLKTANRAVRKIMKMLVVEDIAEIDKQMMWVTAIDLVEIGIFPSLKLWPICWSSKATGGRSGLKARWHQVKEEEVLEGYPSSTDEDISAVGKDIVYETT